MESDRQNRQGKQSASQTVLWILAVDAVKERTQCVRLRGEQRLFGCRKAGWGVSNSMQLFNHWHSLRSIIASV